MSDVIKKSYTPSGGVDLKSTDILRDERYLSGGQNSRYGIQYGFRKRYGFQRKVSQDGTLLGPMASYKFINRFGEQKEELIVMSDGGFPQRIVKGFFTLTNNTGADIELSHYYSESASQFVFGAGTGSYNEGIGDTGDPTVTNLITYLNGLTDITCVVGSGHTSGANSMRAAVTELLADETLPDGESRDVYFYYREAVNGPASGTVTMYNQPTSDRFSLPKMAVVHDVLYIPTAPIEEVSGVEGKRICKYDGLTYYRAGVPEGPRVHITPNTKFGSGASVQDCRGIWTTGAVPTRENSAYRLQLTCHDHIGNVIKGRISPHSRDDNSAIDTHKGLYVKFDDDEASVPPVYANDPDKYGHLFRKSRVKDRGFYDHCGLADGIHTLTLTISVNDAVSPFTHTIEADDVVRFYDTNQSKFISRKVKSTTSSAITISADAIDDDDAGGNVSCYDEAVFSTMTCTVWRTYQNEDDFTPLYFLDEVPVDCFKTLFSGVETALGDVASGVLFYIDSRADEGLQERGVLEFPQYTHGPAPECNFLASYNGLLVGSGDRNNPSAVYFEDILDLESFPLATHSFNAKSACYGLGQSGPALGVFSEDATEVCYGDLAEFNFRVEVVAENIGCISPNSVTEIDEGIISFLSKRGVYTLTGGRNLAPMGAWKDGKSSLLEPLFTALYPKYVDNAPVHYPRFQGALAAVDQVRKLFYLHIPWPVDAGDATDRNLGGPSSETWCYDYGLGSWLPVWTGLDFCLGMAVFDGVLWGMNRPATGAFLANLFKQIVDKGIYNYGDHEAAIYGSIKTHHESLGDPNLYKKYLRVAIGAFGECDSPQWVLEVKSYPNYDYSTVMTNAIATGNLTDKTRVKLKSGKANALMLEFGNQNRYEDFLITGWDLSISTVYGKPSSAFRSDD